MGAKLHDILGNGHRETRKSVHNALPGLLPVDNRCSFDDWGELKKWLVMICFAAPPKRGQKLTHLSLITGPGLAKEDIDIFADGQRVVRKIPKLNENSTAKEFFVLLVSFFGSLLCL